MSRNFGLGQRDMGKAGQIALRNSANRGAISLSTAATNSDRWQTFVAWAKEQGVKKMEHVTRKLVREYGRGLAGKVAAGQMAAATAQNYVSAVNSVMAIATRDQWQSVSPTQDCGIAQRSAVREAAPGALDRGAYGHALEAVREQLSARAAAVVELARELGLRSKEASLLDARAALAQAETRGSVMIRDGTKGGRKREVPITGEGQREALAHAARAQADARAVMPADQDWRSWREGELRDAREVVQAHTGGGLHDLRAAYACERYEALAGRTAPCTGSQIHDRGADLAARLAVSAELGHGRAEVAAEYVGRRRS